MSEISSETAQQWTLISFKEDGKDCYDAVPSKWVDDENSECVYPDPDKTSLKDLNSMALRCVEPRSEGASWITLNNIQIIKQPYWNFDKCRKDMVRLTNKKRTAEESEAERAGQKRRRVTDYKKLLQPTIDFPVLTGKPASKAINQSLKNQSQQPGDDNNLSRSSSKQKSFSQDPGQKCRSSTSGKGSEKTHSDSAKTSANISGKSVKPSNSSKNKDTPPKSSASQSATDGKLQISKGASTNVDPKSSTGATGSKNKVTPPKSSTSKSLTSGKLPISKEASRDVDPKSSTSATGSKNKVTAPKSSTSKSLTSGKLPISKEASRDVDPKSSTSATGSKNKVTPPKSFTSKSVTGGKLLISKEASRNVDPKSSTGATGSKNKVAPTKSLTSKSVTGKKLLISKKASGTVHPTSASSVSSTGPTDTPSNCNKKAAKVCCPAQGDDHNCPWAANGSITLESLAQSVCLISKFQVIGHKEIMKKLEETPSTAKHIAPRRVIKEEDVDLKLLENLPLAKNKHMKDLNEKLKSPTVKDKFVTTLIRKKVTKPLLYPNYTARCVMINLIAPCKTELFTWDGKKRGGVVKIGFKKMEFKDVVFEIVKYHHYPNDLDEGAVAFSVGQWFSQEANKFKTASKAPEVSIIEELEESDDDSSAHESGDDGHNSHDDGEQTNDNDETDSDGEQTNDNDETDIDGEQTNDNDENDNDSEPKDCDDGSDGDTILEITRTNSQKNFEDSPSLISNNMMTDMSGGEDSSDVI
ncbi:uncharacterized protein [Bemisia tabaci]|uniref:uncharacterized protein isoform X2 n=1 Tax=Bemisia tabaci TaxID=7038 RepID=UPI003B284408